MCVLSPPPRCDLASGNSAKPQHALTLTELDAAQEVHAQQRDVVVHPLDDQRPNIGEFDRTELDAIEARLVAGAPLAVATDTAAPRLRPSTRASAVDTATASAPVSTKKVTGLPSMLPAAT